MDDISREPWVDTPDSAKGGGRRERDDASAGPAELLARERAELSEDLVVDPDSRRREADEPIEDGETARKDEESGGEIDTGIERSDLEQAIAAEADTVELEDVLPEELPETDEGLPDVPELADAAAVANVVFVLMLTSREGLSLFRLAEACNTTQKLVEEALALLQQRLTDLGVPVALARTGDTVKWLADELSFPYLQRLRGVKKLEKLSPAALETLAVVAYRQPVMRSEIEAIRGVKAGPMLRSLLQHKLVAVTGRADVPGRPLQYGTTKHFLERFGLSSLQELPSIKEWQNLG
ncbi:MAG: SMC-Scp complex subunit ScpB [Planctomycetes bacterium]|nr:SMC-Scp complex subunit ScpB [Planctomycetota bacterium]